MKKILSLVIVVLAVGAGLAFFFLNQKKGLEHQIVGTWVGPNSYNTITFKADKKVEMTYEYEDKEMTAEGSWKMVGDTLKFELTYAPDGKITEVPEGEFSTVYIDFDEQGEKGFWVSTGMYEKQ